MLVLVFFFFKQKTAYEMRISDWSSDVCSSDLFALVRLASRALSSSPPISTMPCTMPPPSQPKLPVPTLSSTSPPRSEEHTSELQPLKRKSYAVLCLHKHVSTIHKVNKCTKASQTDSCNCPRNDHLLTSTYPNTA